MDSLWAVYNNTAQSDTNRLKAIGDIAGSYISNNPDTAIIIGKKQLQFAEKTKQKKYEAAALRNLGLCYSFYNYKKRDRVKALEYELKSLEIYEEIGSKEGVENCYIDIGDLFENDPKSLEYYTKALAIDESIGNKAAISLCYDRIGSYYESTKNYPKALEYYTSELNIGKAKKYLDPYCLINIGRMYGMEKKYSEELENFEQAFDITKNNNDKIGMMYVLWQIGDFFNEQNAYTKALKIYFSGIELAKEVNNIIYLAIYYKGIGEVYYKMDDMQNAKIYAELALPFTKADGNFYRIKRLSNLLSSIYDTLNMPKKALMMYRQYIQMKDTITNNEQTQKFNAIAFKGEADAKEKIFNSEREKKEQEIENQKLMRNIFIIGFFIFGILAAIIFRNLQQNKKAKAIIENQKEEVEKQRELADSRRIIAEEQKHIIEKQKLLVEEHQREIVDSITYAQRLQRAILPSDEEIKKHLPNSFLLYLPKDIVAGDFYWMEHLDNTVYIAAADSTGHGVPGAMVSVVCSNALNRAVKEFSLRDTGKILDKTRELVLETFAKSSKEVKDGMDISLLAIESNRQKIYWSGAYNPLWYIENGELIEIKADKQAIGRSENPSPFTLHTIKCKPNTTFYLITDGYADQFGLGDKKFMKKKFKELLLSMQDRTLEEQGRLLEEHHVKWKGNMEQTDDVTVIGIKV